MFWFQKPEKLAVIRHAIFVKTVCPFYTGIERTNGISENGRIRGAQSWPFIYFRYVIFLTN